jgi:hypothetical protein
MTAEPIHGIVARHEHATGGQARMNPDNVTDAIFKQLQGSAQYAIDEVTLAWRQAHAHARLAYEQWCTRPSAAAYAQYRAAQDQADSAQDELQAYHTGNAALASS